MALKKAEDKGKNHVELEVSVDAKVFDDACNRAYRKHIKEIAVPGFRAGKAPRKIVEKMYGEKVFFDDAIEMIYPKALEEAVEEAKLDVVGVEKLDVVEAEAGKDFTFKAVCVTKPEVEIKNYKGMKVEKTVKTVTDKDVTDELEQMRKRNGRTIQVEDRPAKNGDLVVFDFEGFIDGKPFEGGKAEKHSLKLGSGQFIPGFEEQIEGKNIGEEFDVNVPFPEDYHAKELAGKQSVFHCKLHEIKTVELPELDDEFAKDVSEFDTIDELKKDLKKKQQERNDKVASEEMEDKLSKELIEMLKADIPDIMFKQRTEELANEFGNRLQSQGMSVELYLQYTGLTQEALKNRFEEQAKEQVKLRLALEKIAELEKIEVTDKELDEKYAELSKQYNMDVEKIKPYIPEEDLRQDLKVERAMEFVKDNAVISEKKAGTKAAAAKKPATKKPAAKKATSTKTTSTKSTSTKKKTTTSTAKKK